MAIRLLVVDDSAFMRKAIENMLQKAPDIQIVGFGRNGKEAVELAEKLRPDVITLDIEMPIMDGLEALSQIMSKCPTSVIMVSSLTSEGAEATIKALELGAVDFLTKDKSFASFGVMKLEDQIIDKIRQFATKKHFRIPTAKPKQSIQPKTTFTPTAVKAGSGNKRIVAIGTSTGGPQSLQKVIPLLPSSLNKPVLVVQHMPPNFTASLANRLNTLSQLTVVEAQGKEKLEPNTVYIAKGGFHLKIKKIGTNYYTDVTNEPSNMLHIPSVDIMVESVSENFGRDALGVIMTGMGSDGLKGLQKLKGLGGAVIAQNQETCVVYGMPRAVVEAGIADEVVPLESIANTIINYCK
ncbi:MAG: response regulator receiver modulated CheB methylesterase [Deferribacteraceae bacterium]|jgi:two-component system chemotaxis response regulator CheB|nr:response regulator receiver modulated CheB methylesterase [Deferribacteraceae bacterium]